MINLRVFRYTLRISPSILLILLIPLAVAGLYRLGVAVTPRDGSGHPMVLSPSLHAARQYLKQARTWLDDLAQIDTDLAALLDESDETAEELYAQGQQMQKVGERTTGLAQRVALAETPVALVGLRDRFVAATGAYRDAALATARWLNAPTEAAHQVAITALQEARSLRIELEESQWLTK
ncbi:MAG TPA: hypothetical protein ENN19_11645 [Chloroflexi bacterium]|nr:hypothetical protein [Chloroflexota bacterium]